MVKGAFALVVAAVIVVGAVSDDDAVATTCYLGVLVGASIGAWVGVRVTPTGRRAVPCLVAVGLSLTALGDVLWEVVRATGADTEVSVADLPWFASYAFLGAALLVVLGQGQTRNRQRVDLDLATDVITIVVVSVLIFWSFSIAAIVADQGATPLERTVLAAYPVADAVLLALVMRVLVSRRARSAIDPSFAVGVSLWLAADIAYLYAPTSPVGEGLMDAAWMVAPVLMASAAWPRARATGRAEETRSVPSGGWVTPMLIAVGPLLVPPALELAVDLRGEPDRPGQLVVGTAALITLAFIRAARLIRSEERSRRELEAARDEALAISHAKSLFVANVSHEIRTPLTTVLATAELLEDTRLDPDQLRLVSRMNRSGERLKGLVEGLLDFSQFEAGQLSVASTPFDLHALVAEVGEVYEPSAVRGGILFECRIDPDAPRTITGDPGRLFQVLTNLLDNAFKFTAEGCVALTLRKTGSGDENDPADGVELLVTDSGIGIRDEDLQAVFESFWQVDGSMTRSYGGNGLGLAICDTLVRLMGGSITVQSRLGTGSTFIVRLPAVH